MNKEEQDFLTEKPTRSNRRNKQKMDKLLNKLIALVSIAIVLTLIIIFSTDSTPEKVVEEPEPVPQQPTEEEVVVQEEEPKEDIAEETTSGENVVSSSADPNVHEVWTNENWTPYPTEQTGPHQSTYQTGHIDYEEKLKAFYSVLPIEQDNSIIWSVRNNGNAESAIAVLSSSDKSAIYRVAIEWQEAQGWLPVQVEVLTNLP